MTIVLENRQGGSPVFEGSTPSPSANSFKNNDLRALNDDQNCAFSGGVKGVKSVVHGGNVPQKRPTVGRKKQRDSRVWFRRDQTRAIPIPELSVEFSTRFWVRVKTGQADACWNWTAAKSSFGYGRVKIGGRLYSTHRVAYTLANGPILNLSEYHGAVVRHSCDNPACCNPAHLCVGDQRDNVHDMVTRGRQSNGGGAS